MYIPKHYKGKDKASAIAFMNRFNFATVITSEANKPIATHLPFIISEKEDKIVLSSHFAKANNQWKEIESKETLTIFTEPHAYISPQFYNKKQNVPTWNYLAIHAYGKVKLILEQDKVLQVLENMIDSFEQSYRQQWEELSMDYKSKMMNGIIAFEIMVSELQFKEKLSQNKKENERLKIIEEYAKSPNENDRLIAEYMAKKANSK